MQRRNKAVSKGCGSVKMLTAFCCRMQLARFLFAFKPVQNEDVKVTEVYEIVFGC